MQISPSGNKKTVAIFFSNESHISLGRETSFFPQWAITALHNKVRAAKLAFLTFFNLFKIAQSIRL